LALAVNIVVAIDTNTCISIPGTISLAIVADAVDSVGTVDTVTSASCPLLVGWAIRHAIGRVPVLVGRTCVADSIDQVEARIAWTGVPVILGILTTDGPTLAEINIPLLTVLTVITLSIDNVVSLVTLASRSIEERVGSTCCACSIHHVVTLTADTTSSWSVIKDIVRRALNASAVEILETFIAKTISSIPAAIGWASDGHTFVSANDSAEGTFTQTAIIVVDWITNTLRANTIGNDEVVEAYVVDSCSIYGTDLQNEVIINVGGEWDGVGSVETEGSQANNIALEAFDWVAWHLYFDNGTEEVLFNEADWLGIENYKSAPDVVEHGIAITRYSRPCSCWVVGGCVRLHAHRRPLRGWYVEAADQWLGNERWIGRVFGWVIEFVINSRVVGIVHPHRGLTNFNVIPISS
jgi:hypothetical protein